MSAGTGHNRWGSPVYKAQPYANDWNGKANMGAVVGKDGYLPANRQGNLPGQRYGNIQGNDGKADGGQVALVRPGQNGAVGNALRQRDGVARVGDSAVSPAIAAGQAPDHYRPEHDPILDVA